MQKYESEGKARKTMPAQDLWFQILTSQVETGKDVYKYVYVHIRDIYFGTFLNKHRHTDPYTNIFPHLIHIFHIY